MIKLALDSTFSLFNWDFSSSVNYEDINRDQFWHEILENKKMKLIVFRLDNNDWVTLDGKHTIANNKGKWWDERFAKKWTVISKPIDKDRFIKALNSHYTHDHNIYKDFEAQGIYFLDSNGLAVLDGGSFCSTRLEYYKKEIVVDKSIPLARKEESIDAVQKFRREIEYVEELPDEVKRWFPPAVDYCEDNGILHYRNRFIPAYTLSERIIHKSLNDYQVVSGLENILSSLATELYCCEHISGRWACQESTVYERIKRRFIMIENSQDNITQIWRDLINSETIEINNKQYKGWPILSEWLETENPLGSILMKKEKCHGDLIFDDILFASNAKYYLIDPNGDAASRFYDLGKLSISLLSGYELLKYNRFSLNYTDTTSNMSPRIELQISEQEMEMFFSIASYLPKILKTSEFCKDIDSLGIPLLILNGIHNASLPFFHLIQHRNQERALAFFAFAVIRLNSALRLYEKKGKISISEAIETCFNDV